MKITPQKFKRIQGEFGLNSIEKLYSYLLMLILVGAPLFLFLYDSLNTYIFIIFELILFPIAALVAYKLNSVYIFNQKGIFEKFIYGNKPKFILDLQLIEKIEIRKTKSYPKLVISTTPDISSSRSDVCVHEIDFYRSLNAKLKEIN